MSLKSIIKRKLLGGTTKAETQELVLAGEPMIYSVKTKLARRTRDHQFFRDMKWKSMLRAFFAACYNTETAVVIRVTFFVSPPSYVAVSKRVLKAEKTHAVFSYEICDYLLSFMEMLHHVLFNSYRQVVKLETEKIYSDNPRTIFQFMKLGQYTNVYGKNPIHPKTQSVGKTRHKKPVQPVQQGNESNENICREVHQGKLS